MFNITFPKPSKAFTVEFSTEPQEFDVQFSKTIVVEKTINDKYEGPYTVTPTRETQILETNGLLMRDNVTINPIPQNYGLVEYNGSRLRIS